MLEDRWFTMIQNLSLNFSLRETWSELDYLNQHLQHSINMQDKVLKEKRLSSFSFKDDENLPRKRKYQMNMSMWELKGEIES